jgi:hypothetical protein
VKKSHNFGVLGVKCAVFLFILLFLLIGLCGCADKTPVETISDNATAQVVALEKSLAPECKTPAIMVQIAALKGEIASAPQACELQMKPIRTERNALAMALFAIVGLFIARIIRKVAL